MKKFFIYLFILSLPSYLFASIETLYMPENEINKIVLENTNLDGIDKLDKIEKLEGNLQISDEGTISFENPNSQRARILTAKDLTAKDNREKKKEFIEALVPIIEEIKVNISHKREKVKNLLNKPKEDYTEDELEFLEQNFAKYNVKNENIKDLLSKLIIPPNSLILAQASLESGWGKSPLALQGNNLFGMRSFSKDTSRSVKLGKNSYYKRYSSINESLEDYVMTLSRHQAYKSLRGGITQGENSLQLIKHLGSYCEDKKTYANSLVTMINNNQFLNYDNN